MKKIVTNILNGRYLEEENIDSSLGVSLDKEITTFLGMGGAITEASGYNYSLLNNEEKEKLIKAYYSSDGLNYEYGRISIASNDFSLDSYEYLDDEDLNKFNIERDKKYIIPLLEDIYNTKPISLIASPWSPPSFMKNNHRLTFGGKLKKKYYDLYSDYLVQFIKKYNEFGFNIEYLTIQNEPNAIQRWESCLFNISEQKEFIYKNLINKLENTKILLWDHNREKINKIIPKLYINNEKVVGIGMHWYTGGYYNNIKELHDKYPDLLLVNTEMCCGYSRYNEFDWIDDAEKYIEDIINSINNGVSMYLDWNIFLDKNGGPSHKQNYVKSVIILDDNKFIKTPIYYYLFHISHFIKKGYKIISINSDSNLLILAAHNNEEKVVVVLNKENCDIEFKINDFKDKINSHSIVTYIEKI